MVAKVAKFGKSTQVLVMFANLISDELASKTNMRRVSITSF